MKNLFTLLCLMHFCFAFTQDFTEKEIITEVNEVTIFLKDAQITRKKTVNLPEGRSLIKFVGLSPFIQAKSIQLKANSQVTVLSVNHQQNFLKKSKKSKELEELEKQLAVLKDKKEVEETYISILKSELEFLSENKEIGGKTQAVTVSNLQQTAEFYSSKLTSIKLKGLERQKTLNDLNNQIADVSDQISTLENKKEFPSGEVLVKVETTSRISVPMELSYVVSNASWFPTYDIRAQNIEEPVELIYKANVSQDTKIDWINAKISFSTADPNISGIAPQLRTYYLDYYSRPPVYDEMGDNSAAGIVFDDSGQPLPGVTVLVKGTSIGTQTDFDGKFSLTLPSEGGTLVFSYIGFVSQEIIPTSSYISVNLIEDVETLDEVVVTGYNSKRKNSVRIRGASSIQGSVNGINSKAQTIDMRTTENQTSVNFEIEDPYTIKSDNQSYKVTIENYELPAYFQYYAVPKINNNAYLIANIRDWEKYNLLEGEANIFFEETYVGKTLLDVRYANDTLKISLGRDKKVSVKREKLKDFTTKQFIGSKKEETRAYETIIRNNKKEAINMIVLDQVPVSTLEEIEVKILEHSKSKLDKESGEVKWEFILSPSDNRTFQLKYTVKYPKNKSLIIE